MLGSFCRLVSFFFIMTCPDLNQLTMLLVKHVAAITVPHHSNTFSTLLKKNTLWL